MKLPKFDYACPATLAEAVALLSASDGTARPIAGGQSLMPMLAFRLAQPSLLVDLRRIPDLDKIAIGPQGVHLGAKVRWCDIETNGALATAHPLLKEAVRNVAHHQIRTRGTVGGSLAHADPAAEMPCVALVCDADIEVFGPNGARTMTAGSFFRGPLTTALDSAELITGIRLPAWPPSRRWAFEEFARRRGDFALAGIALFFDCENGVVSNARIAAFGVADTPIRLIRTEAVLTGARWSEASIAGCGEAARTEVDPWDDIHASSAYRRALVGHLVEQALRRAMASAHEA